jgi:hypothetical protein
MNIYTSKTEYLKTEVQRLSALVRAQQITIDKLEAQPAQKRPQNCGTSYCSCIECVMEPEQKPVKWSDHEPDGMHHNKPAQQNVDRFCDSNCTWSDHHPDCKLAQRKEDK